MKFHATRRGAQIDDRKAGVAGRGGLAVGLASLPFLGQRAEEVLDQLERRRRSDVLGEVAAAGLEDPVDLSPIRADRVTAGDQLERPVRTGQPAAGCGLDDLDPAWAEQVTGDQHVGRPRLGGDHAGRELRSLREDFSAAGVEVQRRSDLAEPTGQQSRVAPRRSLFSCPPVEPAEAPPGHISGSSVGYQLVKGTHTHIVSTLQAGRSRSSPVSGRGSASASGDRFPRRVPARHRPPLPREEPSAAASPSGILFGIHGKER